MQFLLTFDLEENNDTNSSVLSVLNKNDFDAIFFLEGKWVKKFPGRASQITHEFKLGNHSYSHLDLTKLSMSEQFLEIKKCDNILSVMKKQKLKIFRAPFNKTNREIFLALKKANYKYDSSVKKFSAKIPTKIMGVKEVYINAPSDYFLFKIMGFSDNLALNFIKTFLLYHRLLDSLVVFDFHPTQKWGIYSHIKFFKKLCKYLKENFTQADIKLL